MLIAFLKVILLIIVANITLVLAIFDFNFYINNCLNLLYNIKDKVIRFNFKIIIILESLNAKIVAFNILLLFNNLTIGHSSFFLSTFFNIFYLSSSLKIS